MELSSLWCQVCPGPPTHLGASTRINTLDNPINTTYLYNIYTMLDQELYIEFSVGAMSKMLGRQCANIMQMFGEALLGEALL